MAFNKRELVTAAATKIWQDFVWLHNHTDTPYASSEYPINKHYSIFAFEESDDGGEEGGKVDKWITLSIEKYDDYGRCVNDFVATATTLVITRQALSTGISNLLKAFENKVGSFDALAPDSHDWRLQLPTCHELTCGDIARIKWLFSATDFSNAQIAQMFDVSAVKISKIRLAECGVY